MSSMPPHRVKEQRICSHSWINPTDPPIQRSPYSPVIGPRRREMKEGTAYRCNNCGLAMVASAGRPR